MTIHSHSDHSHSGHSALRGDDEHGHGGIGKYLSVFFALCVLTVISFVVGSNQYLRVNAPGVMWASMMAVSCAKAMLVILFFMHLKWEANWKYVLTVPASIMSIFLMLMLIPDVGRRTNRYSEERWLHAAEIQSHAADDHHAEPPEKERTNSFAAPGPAPDGDEK